MSDPFASLAMTAAQEVVKVILYGMVDLVKKIPALWRRVGDSEEQAIGDDIRRTARELAAIEGEDRERAIRLQEELWRQKVQALLDGHPDAAADVARFLAEFAATLPASSGNTYNTQNIVAEVPGSSAYGVLNAAGGQGSINVHHHHGPSGLDTKD